MNGDIEVKYNGASPNLCSGDLEVTIGDKNYKFPIHCLSSGGRVTSDGNGDFEVTKGEWSINRWPDDFPEGLKEATLEEVNNTIPWGCCGGCI